MDENDYKGFTEMSYKKKNMRDRSDLMQTVSKTSLFVWII